MSTLFLVRHAHADWTPDEQRPLSARGELAAQHVANLLAEQPIAAVYASTARRAQQTVLPLAIRLGLPIREREALCERRLSAAPLADFEQAVRKTRI